MELNGKPIKLPLDESITRCLAHGHLVGEWCEKRAECACNETIKYDRGLNPQIAYRKCSSDDMACFMPISGFSEPDGLGIDR